MANFGVTPEGFNIKGFDTILEESKSRAKDIFGQAVDLTDSSPLYKILQVVAAEDAALWQRMEDLYYGNFISTAGGDNLDLLGQDVGRTRRNLFATGEVTFQLANDPAPGRVYILPEGTILTTATGQKFYTTTSVSLVTSSDPDRNVTSAAAPAQAYRRGPAGNIAGNEITGIDPQYAQHTLNLLPGTIEVTNDGAFSGGEKLEADEDYRARLLGLPRNIWTLESVRREVLDVDGVKDVLVFDSLGGLDVSQSIFNTFNFAERLFSGERRLGEIYFFDIVVAHEFGWPWRTTDSGPGIFDQVQAAVDRVRPVGIHPNIIQANHIEVGARAKVLVERGTDAESLVGTIKARLERDTGALKLGGDVLYSQVMCAFVEQIGVIDVQHLHLRRCPPLFGRVSFGRVPFQAAAIEAARGENLVMGPREIAVFRLDSELIEIEVVAR